MNLLKFVEIDGWFKGDELTLSRFWGQNVDTSEVINMVVKLQCQSSSCCDRGIDPRQISLD